MGSVLSALKADLAPCGCGVNMVDGALKHPWVVLSNSKIKSDGWSNGCCRKWNRDHFVKIFNKKYEKIVKMDPKNRETVNFEGRSSPL